MIADWLLVGGVWVLAAVHLHHAWASRSVKTDPPANNQPQRLRAGIAPESATVAGELNQRLQPRASMASLRAGLAATMTEEQARQKRVDGFSDKTFKGV